MMAARKMGSGGESVCRALQAREEVRKDCQLSYLQKGSAE
jgi:hypothetical protein